MTEEPFYVAPSRISTFLECGLKGWRRYVKKIPSADKPPLVFLAGDCQHRALEVWGRGDTELHDLVRLHREAWLTETPKALADLMTQALDLRGELAGLEVELDRIAEEIQRERPKLKDPRRTKEFREAAATAAGDRGDRLARVLGQIDAFFVSDASPWKPTGPRPMAHYEDGEDSLRRFVAWWGSLDDPPDIVHVEAKGKITFGDGAFLMNGRIDAVYLWPDGSVEVVDYKRSSGREDSISLFVQAAAYALTCKTVIGLDPSRIAFHHLKEGQRLVFDVKPEWPARLEELAARVKRMHDAGDFAPSFRTCNWCDYRSLCHKQFAFDGVFEDAAPPENKEAA